MWTKRCKWTAKSLLAASVASMALSVCLCVGTTCAWFQDTLKNPGTIQIGYFLVDTTAVLGQTRSASQVSSSGTVLPQGFYQLTVKGLGNTSGFAKIVLSANVSGDPTAVYTTPLMRGGTAYTYELMLNEQTTVRVGSVWAAAAPESALENGERITYGRPPAPPPSEEEEVEGEQEEQNDTPAADGGTQPPSADTAATEQSTPSADDTSADGGTKPPSADTAVTEQSTPSADDTSADGGTQPPSADTAATEQSTPSADDTSADGGTQPPLPTRR